MANPYLMSGLMQGLGNYLQTRSQGKMDLQKLQLALQQQEEEKKRQAAQDKADMLKMYLGSLGDASKLTPEQANAFKGALNQLGSQLGMPQVDQLGAEPDPKVNLGSWADVMKGGAALSPEDQPAYWGYAKTLAPKYGVPEVPESMVMRRQADINASTNAEANTTRARTGQVNAVTGATRTMTPEQVNSVVAPAINDPNAPIGAIQGPTLPQQAQETRDFTAQTGRQNANTNRMDVQSQIGYRKGMLGISQQNANANSTYKKALASIGRLNAQTRQVMAKIADGNLQVNRTMAEIANRRQTTVETGGAALKPGEKFRILADIAGEKGELVKARAKLIPRTDDEQEQLDVLQDSRDNIDARMEQLTTLETEVKALGTAAPPPAATGGAQPVRFKSAGPPNEIKAQIKRNPNWSWDQHGRELARKHPGWNYDAMAAVLEQSGIPRPKGR